MKFGAHVSIAGGIPNAPKRAAELRCEVFQFFSRSPQGGPAPKITPTLVETFRAQCERFHLSEWVIHTPYYLNFASGEERIRNNSSRIVREELERGTLLGARYVMFHPGSARDVGLEQAMTFCVGGIKRALDGYTGTTRLLIEISAGAGMVIGDAFEEVAALLEGVGDPELGVCFDTAHAFASGYDLRDAERVTGTLKTFDRIVGLSRLKMSHCNDSKVNLGERKDRHEHLGKGFIGIEGFRALVHSPLLPPDFNLYLETEGGGVQEDLTILKALREERVDV